MATKMRAHLFIAFGLLVSAIFIMRGLEALRDPGLGLREGYVLGGFTISGLLVRHGLKMKAEDASSRRQE